MSYLEKRNQIDLLQKEINDQVELSDDVKKKIHYKFRLDWNYYSNSMEGNTLTKEETRSVMVGNLTVGGKPIKDVLEMKGHNEVIGEILKIGKGEARISEAKIKQIHRGIMHEDDPIRREKIGKWKTEPNYLYNYKNEKFEFTLPADVPTKMHELLNKINADIDSIEQNKKNSLHPIDIALQFHLDYVLIHPFYDGNGRTARILTNLILISFGYPPFWIKTNEREIYLQYLADIQGYGGNPDLFFDFAAGSILRSQNIVLDAIKGKEIEESGDLEKKVKLLKQKLENSTDEVKIEKTKEVSLDIFNNSIKPLLNEIIRRLQQFTPLFKSQQITLAVGGNFYDNLKELLKENKDFIDSEGEITNVILTYNLIGFRKMGVKTFHISVPLKIQFHQFVYEISSQNNKEIISKLYHQYLNSDEMENISEILGNKLFEQIETNMEKINDNKG